MGISEPMTVSRGAARRLLNAISEAFKRKEGFSPSKLFKINIVKDKIHECIMMGIILSTFEVFYVFVSNPLFLCNEINVCYVQFHKGE